MGGDHPPPLVEADRVLVAGDDRQADALHLESSEAALHLFHQKGADAPAAQLGLDREGLELAHPLAGREARVALANPEEGEADRPAFALCSQQPSLPGADPAPELGTAGGPALGGGTEWQRLTLPTGELGVVLVHRPPEGLDLVEAVDPGFADLDLRWTCLAGAGQGIPAKTGLVAGICAGA